MNKSLSLVYVFLLVIGSALSAPCIQASEARTSYDLQVSLDYATASFQVVEKITYYNRTGQSLSSLVFNVTPAYYQAFRLQRISIEGKDIPYKLQGVVLEATLPEPLQTEAQVTVEMAFTLVVPPHQGRFGVGNGIIALGNWYPVLAVFNGDWDRHQYVEIGDAFYTEVVDYRVTLWSSEPVTVAHSGTQVSHDGNQWVFLAEKVRDFALAISKHYQSASQQVDGTIVTSYFLPEHRAGGELALRAAAESLRWFGSTLGRYPYPSLGVAEIYAPTWIGSGQEYPNLVFVASGPYANPGGMGDYLSYLVAHEIGHQWFYGLVGNDQVNDPWLDEALTTHTTLAFFKQDYPTAFPSLWSSRVNDGYEKYHLEKGDRPVNTSIYDYDDELYYFAMVYRRGALFLEELRDSLGDEAYFRLLRDYVNDFSYDIATPQSFFAQAQRQSEVDLRPLFTRYFTYPWLKGLSWPAATPSAAATATVLPALAATKPATGIPTLAATPGERDPTTEVLLYAMLIGLVLSASLVWFWLLKSPSHGRKRR
ncbi:MAG: M1 family metallopeptidase [Chloroflexota bacterium]